MAKTISVYRRRADLVDLWVAQRDNVRAFVFKYAANFDVGAAAFQTVPRDGFRSPGAFDAGVSEAFRGRCRFTFKPADYGIDDTKPMWLRIAPVATDGSVGADEAFHLVLPYSSQPRRAVVVSGSAAAGADVSASTELNLPMQCQNLELQNNGAADLFVAFEKGGAEYQVEPLSTGFTNLSMVYPCFSQLFVRGSGGAVGFSAVMSLRDERT
jgi:hypothetical protein